MNTQHARALPSAYTFTLGGTDPCNGVAKRLSAAVRCGFPGGYNVCQGGIAENVNNVPFQCASGYVFNAVDYAYWGQASQIVGSCQANGFSYSTTGPCGTAPIGAFNPNGWNTVTNACIGQSSCSVSSTQAFWGGKCIITR